MNTIASPAFVKSSQEEYVWYMVGMPAPTENFYFDFNASSKVVMLERTREFIDRGVPCIEFGVPSYMSYDERRDQIKVRFYQTNVQCSPAKCTGCFKRGCA